MIPSDPRQDMWQEGAIAKIEFGFGSRNDLNSYYAAVCDNCFDTLEEQGIVLRDQLYERIIKEKFKENDKGKT
jgi:hypothetical protein